MGEVDCRHSLTIVHRESMPGQRTDNLPHRRRANVGTAAMLSPVLILFVFAYVLPVSALIVDSFRKAGSFTLSNHLDSLTSAAFRIIIWRTLSLSLAVTVLCLLVGYPLAYALSRLKGRLAVGLLLVVSIPYVTSILIRTYAWIVLLSGNGIINQLLMRTGLIDEPVKLVFNDIGVYIGMVQVQLPLMVFPLYAAMRRTDRSLVAAARSLGSSPVSAVWNVVVPLSVPGIASGCILVFLSCLGFYVTPALLGGPGSYLVAQGITVRVMTLADFDSASAQATLLLLVVLVLFVALRRRLATELGDETTDRSRLSGTRAGLGLRSWPRSLEAVIRRIAPILRQVGDWISFVRVLLLWGAAILALLYLVLPLLVVIPLAFSNAPYLTFPPPSYSLRWFNAFLANEQWLSAAWFSAEMASLSAVISLLIGAPAAFALVRRTLVGRLPMYLLLISPLVVPQVVVAVALYFALASAHLVGTKLAFIIAYVLIGVPYVVVIFVAGLRRFDRSLEVAAASLGATPFAVLRTVTLPLLLPTLASSFLFSFIIGFDDVVFGLFLGGAGATPLPIRMWDNIRLEISPQIAVVAVALLVVLFLCYSLQLIISTSFRSHTNPGATQ